MINPYNVLRYQGVRGARTVAIPQNFQFELTMDTWWSAVTRAHDYSDYTGLDALYSYVMKSSTVIRSAIDKRLRPLKARTFGVYINGVEDERLTKILKSNTLVKQLVYQRGLANFTFARVIGVTKDNKIFVYPLRNLDVVNKAVKGETFDSKGKWIVKNHVNLFWVQTSYQSEDTLGLLEPISRDYINMVNAQNNWQSASNFLAYPQLMMFYENGDEKMEQQAIEVANQIALGSVPVVGKITDELTGNTVKEMELENANNGTPADTFRIFKENLEQLRDSIMNLILGSSLLGMSNKNTNSERLVRALLKLFKDICEDDASEVEDWLNDTETKTKLAYLLNEPLLAVATFQVKPSNYIDTGDIETFTKMLSDLGLMPTDTFVEKTGLDTIDVVGYENSKDVGKRNAEIIKLREENTSERSITSMAMDSAKRFFNRNKSRDGDTME